MFKVRVPITSANIGPGFDCLGVALNIYNYFTAEIIDKGIIIEGCDNIYKNDDNLVYKSMKYLFEKANYKPSGIKITIESVMPSSSGTGSSACCICGGLMLANLILEEKFSKEEILNFAIEIEGHPDNVTPAMLGGMTISMKEKDKYFSRKILDESKFKFAVLISNQKKESTKKLREVLNKTVKLEDAIYNISHSLMMIEGFKNNDKALLKNAMKDKLHEEMRGSLIKNFENIKNISEKLGAISLNVSGAGPSLILTYDDEFDENKFKEKLFLLEEKWEFLETEISLEGAKQVRI